MSGCCWLSLSLIIYYHMLYEMLILPQKESIFCDCIGVSFTLTIDICGWPPGHKLSLPLDLVAWHETVEGKSFRILREKSSMLIRPGYSWESSSFFDGRFCLGTNPVSIGQDSAIKNDIQSTYSPCLRSENMFVATLAHLLEDTCRQPNLSSGFPFQRYVLLLSCCLYEPMYSVDLQ